MTVLEKLKSTGLLFDGAMGSMLMSRGMPAGMASEMMNIQKPDVVLDIHKAYLTAGSDVITTNTFGGSPIKMKSAGIEHLTEEANKMAVRIARQACSAGQFVAGDIGPMGNMLEPLGLISENVAIESFAQQAKILADGGVDLFIVETMFDINESLAAIRGIRSVSDLPIFATLTFAKGPLGFATIMGNQVAESMHILAGSGASAVGANCSIGSDLMIELATEIRNSVVIPVIIQSNAGLPESIDGQLVYPETPEIFAANISQIKALGVEILGGCCGTTPEYIQAIRKSIA
ncbi:homocysteine S-methyltransferase family protein [bacterium]|nr:homocysteine S-methyltransferase family protein [bacterium]MBU1633793.1 homocysteine S-methyltransferase family protein [bacterium]MBU1872208.1 homocysteine S-methyltransferase family protein [bacterium]